MTNGNAYEYCRTATLQKVVDSEGNCIYSVYKIYVCNSQTYAVLEEECDLQAEADRCENPNDKNCANFKADRGYHLVQVPSVGGASRLVDVRLDPTKYKDKHVGDLKWHSKSDCKVKFQYQDSDHYADVCCVDCGATGTPERVGMAIEVAVPKAEEHVLDAKMVIEYQGSEPIVQIGFEFDGQWAFATVWLLKPEK